MNCKHKPMIQRGRLFPHRPQIVYAGRYAGDCSGPAPTPKECELMLLKSGRYEIKVGDDWLAGSAGDLFVFPPGLQQFKRAKPAIRTTFVLFHAPAQFDARARVLRFGGEPRVRRWMEDVCDCFEASSTCAIAAALLSAILERIAAVEAVPAERPAHPALARAIRFLEEHSQRPCSVKQVASAAHVSLPHLTMLFRTQLGISPLQYHQRLRIERAQRLLRNPYLKIHEVAAACGYGDANYFLRLFRMNVGAPPGRWRASQ